MTFSKKLCASFFIVILSGFVLLHAAEEVKVPPDSEWSFEGPFGTYNRAELQRGFQVYSEVCSSCHGMKLISYRHLLPLFIHSDRPSKEEVEGAMAIIKAIAASKEVSTTDDEGNPTTRKGLLSDIFRSPYANEKAARAANNGALPPDLSTIVKSRKGHADYVRALLTGYSQCPSDFNLAPGMYYNVYFSGHQIAMAPPLSDGQLQYSDGTPATVGQMARDVAAFLAFISEPEMEARKELGVQVMFFLLIFTAFMFFVMRRVWSPLK